MRLGPGKRASRRSPELVAAVNSVPLLRIADTLSGRIYLVDSGAQVSVAPHQSHKPPVSHLLAADGRPIPCWGSVELAVSIGEIFSGKHCFARANVQNFILGADFFVDSGICIDLKNRRLLPPPVAPPPARLTSVLQAPILTRTRSRRRRGRGQRPPSLFSPPPPPPAPPMRPPSLERGVPVPTYAEVVSHVPVVPLPGSAVGSLQHPPPEFQQLLGDFPDVTNKDDIKFAQANPAHRVAHHILTAGPPVSAKARRLDPEKLEAAKAEFAAMEQAGIIRRSDSPWASPLHMVAKPDGSWRPTGDYRRLNQVTVPDSYPLPNVNDFSANLHGKKFFSKLDLVKGYYQVPMNKSDIAKTAVITPFGLFEWLVMPFGVRNAANTFQRLMDRVLDGLPFAFVYLDDILVASATRERHVADVREVLLRLKANGLVINPNKSEFCRLTVTYLGHQVSESGIAPLSKNTDALMEFPPPTTRRELQRFLGMLNFYRRFLRNAAGVIKPLTDALCGKPTSRLKWSEECAVAFRLAKQLLADAVELHHPVPGAPLSLTVDASGTHVGAVLSQLVAGEQQPLAFFSSKLNEAQQNYSAFDRELLAAYLALRHFRFQLEGRPFVLYTDHKPLLSAIDRKSPPLLARQARQLSFLSEFAVTIVHLPGKDNVTADAFSRPPAITSIATVPPPCPLVDFVQLAKAQLTCSSMKVMLSSGMLHVQPFPLPDGEVLLCDVSASVPRPLVPVGFTFAVFEAVHNLSHPGTRATLRLVSAKFVWCSMKAQIRQWCRQCVGCQRGKVTRHASKPIKKIPVPELPFSTVHIDLVGPLPLSDGYRYLFTMIDRTTR